MISRRCIIFQRRENIAVTRFTATLTTLHRSPEAELRPFEIPCFFSYNPESLALHVQSIGVSALAVDCFFHPFYIVNALHQRESEIRQEFNLSSDQAQRFIQRTSDVMKELKYIAENRLSAENGVLSPRGRERRRMCLRLNRYLLTLIVPQ